MYKNKLRLMVGLSVILLAALACGTFGGGAPASGGGAAGGSSAGTDLRQWAATASASSEYGSSDWSARQATGAPNTLECGDTITAWASSSSSGQDWLEVGYSLAVVPSTINIHQSYNPGSIVKVEVKDTSGNYTTVYTASPVLLDTCPYTLSIPVSGISTPVNVVRITLDQSVVQDWNEIDAVELIGSTSS